MLHSYNLLINYWYLNFDLVESNDVHEFMTIKQTECESMSYSLYLILYMIIIYG